MENRTKLGIGLLVIGVITYIYSQDEKPITKQDLLNRDDLSIKAISKISLIAGIIVLVTQKNKQ
jgi:hypothetical protein